MTLRKNAEFKVYDGVKLDCRESTWEEYLRKTMKQSSMVSATPAASRTQ